MTHKAALRTADGKVSHSTHAGKFKITRGQLPIFLPALAVPAFHDNLISVGHLARHGNVVFSKHAVYITPSKAMGNDAHQIGTRGKDNLYTLINTSRQTDLVAAPVTPHPQAQKSLHETMNHTHPPALRQFTTTYPEATQAITRKLPDQSTKPCVPCVLGNAKRAPFPTNPAPPLQPLEAVSTDTTGPITPADIDGNRYLQIIVDAATGHTTGWPMKQKIDAAEAIMKNNSTTTDNSRENNQKIPRRQRR